MTPEEKRLSRALEHLQTAHDHLVVENARLRRANRDLRRARVIGTIRRAVKW